ncbi:LamG domain-containing protein [Streptomyces sp. NBC_01136]|uniref:LamG domain-containing protein n=1 Tax=unclassified Streptomyces TaxID=2593676 RepID=UPI00324E1CC9|nr:LamG domain-containing protein [Streptomyces sp. NBC_01136]
MRRITLFDLGTGVTANMFLTPLSGDDTLRYAITAGRAGAEQRIDAEPLPTDRWVHVALTHGSGTAVLCADGQQAGRNAPVTVKPRYFGNHIRAGYLGRSQYAGPCSKGAVDDFRVHGKTLTAEEVAALAQAWVAPRRVRTAGGDAESPRPHPDQQKQGEPHHDHPRPERVLDAARPVPPQSAACDGRDTRDRTRPG